MIFYKNVLISTILSAILFVAIVGGVMYYYKNKQIYPPVISACPDFYNLDGSNNCIRTAAWPVGTSECSTLNFSDLSYLLPGTKTGSGICNKKNMATTCGVTWDGITNNSSICLEPI
jgi:hypothetical protein